ncbi:MAG: 1-acyl-sn-glycerol-3-phosphate acyltransferase [Candidatus Omnitrophica bacterium]|nr:1-acyl-sn-glycerol-3-phosphate acyltransferase [Candidatus Omnitrophota bacterium]
MRNILRVLFFIFILRPVLYIFIGLRIYGRENLPLSTPYILIANHSSHLDTAALLSLFPIHRLGKVRPVAAADYFEKNPFVSWLAHTFFNILSIERAHINRECNPIDKLKDALKQKNVLIIFPEGTRSKDGTIGPFHAGVVHLIKEHGNIPIIPVYLNNMYRALPKGELILLPFFCEVHIGQPIALEGPKDTAVKQLREAVIRLKENRS